MDDPRITQIIRDAGGIVHSDGNIFFTNHYQFEHAASLVCGVATVAQQPAQQTDAEKLAEGIANAAQRAGIYNGEVPLTGPHLLMLLDDLASAAAPQQPSQLPPAAKGQKR
jgi:hypothetical protein